MTEHLKTFFGFRNSLIYLIATFFVLTILAKTYPYFGFDLIISQTFQQFNPAWFVTLMQILSQFGRTLPSLLVLVISSIIIVIIGRWRDSLMLIVSTVGIYFLTTILKTVVARPRPDPTLIWQIGDPSLSSGLGSFPSGHVLLAMGFYGFLLFLIYSHLKVNWGQKLVMVVLMLIIGLMGLSRIYLGAHWFSDVLGSYLIGSAWLLLMIHLHRQLS